MNLGHLLCRAGWHAPLPGGRWNGGYCFTTCRRCGRDMVRSAFGEWHVPRGFRVVWGAAAPGEGGSAPTAPVGNPPPAGTLLAARQASNVAPEQAPPTLPAEPAPVHAMPAPAEPTPPPAPPVQRRSPSTSSPFDFDDFDRRG